LASKNRKLESDLEQAKTELESLKAGNEQAKTDDLANAQRKLERLKKMCKDMEARHKTEVKDLKDKHAQALNDRILKADIDYTASMQKLTEQYTKERHDAVQRQEEYLLREYNKQLAADRQMIVQGVNRSVEHVQELLHHWGE
jgi:hypothetical protein